MAQREIQIIDWKNLILDLINTNSDAMQSAYRAVHVKAACMKVAAVGFWLLIGVAFIGSISGATKALMISKDNVWPLLSVVFFSIMCGPFICAAPIVLYDRGENAKKLIAIHQKLVKHSESSFNDFIAKELPALFPKTSAEQLSSSIQSHPTKFLQIIGMIDKLYACWSDIERRERAVNQYGSMLKTYKNKDNAFVQESPLVRDELSKNMERNTDVHKAFIEMQQTQFAKDKAQLRKMIAELWPMENEDQLNTRFFNYC